MRTASGRLLGLARAAASSAPPVAGYSAWYDPSDSATVTDAGSGAVSQLSDKSGNAKHMVQATGANRPTTGLVSYNGYNALRYSGSQYLSCSSLVIADPCTVFAVLKVGGSGTATTQWFSTNSGGAFNPGYFGIGTPGGSRNAWRYSWTFGTADSASSITRPLASHSQVSSIINGASSGHWLDGTSNVTGSMGSASYTSWLIGGGWNSGFTAGWQGDIGEIIVYPSALGTTDRQSVESYLKTKWGTP